MAQAQLKKENRFHRDFTEICEDELLLAIRENQFDADQARTELKRRGWLDSFIDRMSRPRK